MLPLVETPIKKLSDYSQFASPLLLEEVENLGRELKGKKVFMLNSTPRGGGVAEILKSLIPLMKGLGLDARWYTTPCPNNFFKLTKKIHNGLQGKKVSFSIVAKRRYLKRQKEIAFRTKDMKPDIWVVHDPQPAGIISYRPHFHPAVCRLHIDLTSPNKKIWNFMTQFLNEYDKIIVTSPDYIQPEIKNKTVVFAPGIDPLVLKNQPMEKSEAKETIENFGVSKDKPLLSQVCRFDIFKDPLGSILAYKEARKEIPGLQFVILGFFLASDDPTALKIYKIVEKEAKDDPDIFLFSDINRLGGLRVDAFVRAVQTASDVILQKSTREGFGLVVTEAMWKEKPVVAGDVGGIRLQIENGRNGFLVSSPKEAAERIKELIKNPDLAVRLGRAARETVREKFLIIRVLRDYLRIFKELV